MNDRIADLAARAWDQVDLGNEQYGAEYSAKLAVLIVRECAKIADDAASHNLPPSKFGQLIMEEFGVK